MASRHPLAIDIRFQEGKDMHQERARNDQLTNARHRDMRTVHHPDRCTGCQCRLESAYPRGVSCDEGLFKSDNHPIVEWSLPNYAGAIWHAWEASASDLEAMDNHPSTRARDDRFIGGLGYDIAVSPEPNGLKLESSTTNRSRRTFRYVKMYPCLSAVSPTFQDDALDRTTMLTDAGLTALKDTDGRTGDPIRTPYLVAGRRPAPFYGEWFRGKPSRIVARRGRIPRTSASGRFTIGMDWDRVYEIYNNEDAHHHCVLSVPLLGDVSPGQTRTVRGKTVFAAGGAQLTLERLQSEAPSAARRTT